jgi:hypothetical protein
MAMDTDIGGEVGRGTPSESERAATATDEAVAPSPRMAEFERQIAALRLRGQGGNVESRLLYVGVGLLVLGLLMVGIAWFRASDTTVQHEQIDYLISGGLGGIGVTLIGAAIYLRISLTRYFRLWLVRLLYEQRAQTDRTVEALERIEAALRNRPS